MLLSSPSAAGRPASWCQLSGAPSSRFLLLLLLHSLFQIVCSTLGCRSPAWCWVGANVCSASPNLSFHLLYSSEKSVVPSPSCCRQSGLLVPDSLPFCALWGFHVLVSSHPESPGRPWQPPFIPILQPRTKFSAVSVLLQGLTSMLLMDSKSCER